LDSSSGFAAPDAPTIRLGDPSRGPGFDPIWGSLGPSQSAGDDWLTRTNEDEPEGVAVDVEIFGDGFQISGQIHTGQFDRLSDWINMQSGFIQVRDAWHVHLGQANIASEQRRGTLWVRLEQVVLVAERTAAQTAKPGAPVVQKQKRKVSIVTPGYSLRANMYLHAYGSMKQFLESPDPHFLPVTDLAIRWLNDAAMAARFPFAMINRVQLITILDESTVPAGGEERRPGEQSAEDLPLLRRSGAA
jgi:hypothetical protein